MDYDYTEYIKMVAAKGGISKRSYNIFCKSRSDSKEISAEKNG